MSRGVFLLAALFLLIGPLMLNAAERVNVATPVRGLVELPVVAAMRNRYYRAEGLEVQKIQIDPEIAVKTLVAGEVEFLLGWEDPLRAAIAGAPIKLVAATVSRPLHVLIARPETRSARDIKGKAVGIDWLSSPTDYLSRVALRHLGLEPEKNVDLVEVGGSQARIAALRTGAIQATALDSAVAAGLEEQGHKRLVHTGDIIDLPIFGVAVATTKLATDRDRIKRFLRATLQGARFSKRNRVDSLFTIQSYLKLPRSHAARAWDSSAQYFTDDGFISDRALALAARRAEERLQFSHRASLSQLVDWSLIRELAAERRKVPFWLKQYDP